MRTLSTTVLALVVALAAASPALAGKENFTIPVTEPAPATLFAEIYTPSGHGPYPTVLLMHGCGGVSPNVPVWAVWLQSKGYAAVVLNSFSGRNIRTLCGDSKPLLPEVRHAIEAHSYSAGIAPRTPEAKVVQDADRLDALGAIGLARCIAVGSALGRPVYEPEDPFCRTREPDDRGASVDHFYTKLLNLAGTMQTAAGRREAERRTAFLRAFLAQLETEIAP